MRAFIYVRVSTVDQEYSPDVQKEQCRAYCAARRYEVVDVFDESGVSASKAFRERAVGRSMFERIDEADAIVFAKLDRAFRDTVDCIMTVDALREAGKTVHFLDLGVDTSTAAGGLCLQMMAAFAEFERRRISDRTREAMAVARSRGVKIGPAPYGYDNVVEFGASGDRTSRGEHRRKDDEFAVVQQVISMHNAGAKPSAIAVELNTWGIPTRLGGQWSRNHIVRMLNRETR